MAIMRQKRKILGRKNDNTGVLLPKGTKVIPANQALIDSANAELRKKCESQKINDAEASISLKEMWACGIAPFETGGCYFETQPEDQIIYGGPVKKLKR